MAASQSEYHREWTEYDADNGDNGVDWHGVALGRARKPPMTPSIHVKLGQARHRHRDNSIDKTMNKESCIYIPFNYFIFAFIATFLLI